MEVNTYHVAMIDLHMPGFEHMYVPKHTLLCPNSVRFKGWMVVIFGDPLVEVAAGAKLNYIWAAPVEDTPEYVL